MIFDIYSPQEITDRAKSLFRHERSINRLDGWFIAKEKELEIKAKEELVEEEVDNNEEISI